MRFRTTVELGGKTATGFQVLVEVIESLDRGKRVPVQVTINGHSYRSTIAPYSGAYYLPLSAENRAAAGVAAGEDIQVDIEHDDKPREIDVPADLAGALDAAGVRQAFEALSYSRNTALELSAATLLTTDRRWPELGVKVAAV